MTTVVQRVGRNMYTQQSGPPPVMCLKLANLWFHESENIHRLSSFGIGLGIMNANFMLAIDQFLSHSLILENDAVLIFGYSYIYSLYYGGKTWMCMWPIFKTITLVSSNHKCIYSLLNQFFIGFCLPRLSTV